MLQSKELEIEIRYRDWRSMCAFTVIKLGDFVEPAERAGMVLRLEPEGELFAEVAVDIDTYDCIATSSSLYFQAQNYQNCVVPSVVQEKMNS